MHMWERKRAFVCVPQGVCLFAWVCVDVSVSQSLRSEPDKLRNTRAPSYITTALTLSFPHTIMVS
jgi:hypothetical protein